MEIKSIKSNLKLASGLHIGMQDDGMRIGGIDSPVLKREVLSNNEGVIVFDKKSKKIIEPYIAGSSLKGKIRSLLEHYFRLIDPNGDGQVVNSKTNFGDLKKRELIIKLFGEASNASEKISGNISRLIFRDCYITNEVRRAKYNNQLEFFEAKMENVIDRKTGTTKDGGLRTIERVNSSIEFDFEVCIRIFTYSEDEIKKNSQIKNDDGVLYEKVLKLGLKLLELDALGGSGSRGYGKVIFSDIKDDIKDLTKEIDELIKKVA